MSKFAFLSPPRDQFPWLGDELSLKYLMKGLNLLGHETIRGYNLVDADYIFLCNLTFNHAPLYNALKLMGKPYGMIPFYPDYEKYTPAMCQFADLVELALEDSRILEGLLAHPEIVHRNTYAPQDSNVINQDVVRDASLLVTSSPTESATVIRDCKQANPHNLFLSPGMATGEIKRSDCFLKISGAAEREYLLQVGRLEPRKNQLATVLASRNLDIPLVFIASRSIVGDWYSKLVIEAIIKWRKAPTYIYSTEMAPLKRGNLSIINQSFSKELLISAFQNAGMYVHPAFTELPGYVYLEAVKLGTPTVASSWATINDYFPDNIIHYSLPYHINNIENLITRFFGSKIDPSSLEILKRTEKNVAQDFLKILALQREKSSL
ncbi:MAG: glycosyltransferase [Simkaniaceae bacterium]|nr:glycosyltransferase [Simkaniaceae bacterium]